MLYGPRKALGPHSKTPPDSAPEPATGMLRDLPNLPNIPGIPVTCPGEPPTPVGIAGCVRDLWMSGR